eukprot:gb/GECG01000962.1/.p1 GENE.gb/GECG01000962.1/~~gb/GECG01000962.1/.p1  ORF type:complete len:101 (+),score=6.92 gb/GECG01000962.1/:1-303(+)
MVVAIEQPTALADAPVYPVVNCPKVLKPRRVSTPDTRSSSSSLADTMNTSKFAYCAQRLSLRHLPSNGTVPGLREYGNFLAVETLTNADMYETTCYAGQK